MIRMLEKSRFRLHSSTPGLPPLSHIHLDVSCFVIEGRWSRKTVFAINLIEVFVLQEIKSGNQSAGGALDARLLARRASVPPCPVHAWEMTLAICGAKNKQFDSGGILLMQRESSAKRPLLSLDAIWRHPNVRPPSVCSP